MVLMHTPVNTSYMSLKVICGFEPFNPQAARMMAAIRLLVATDVYTEIGELPFLHMKVWGS